MSQSCYFGSIIGMIVAIFGVVGWIAYAYVRPDQLARVFNPLLALFNVIAYGTASIFFHDCGAELMETWCSLLKLHLIILITSEGIFHLLRERIRDRTLLKLVKERNGEGKGG